MIAPRLHRAQRDDEFVRAVVADHADRLDRQKHRKRLADFVIPTVLLQLFEINRIGLAQQVGVFFFDFAEDAHTEAGPGERMTLDDGRGQAELQTDFAHLVFEQLAQRLQQFELHARRQAADIVMRFNHPRRAVRVAGRLDDIRVDGALREMLGGVDSLGFRLEDFHEQIADALAFAFRVCDALQAFQKPRFGVDANHAHTQMRGEGAHNQVAFVQP